MRHALRIAREPHPDLGDDAERAFAADNRADQVGPRRILGRPADLHDLAVGRDQLHAQHVVDRDAILERVRPAGIRGHVAADRARPLARRIGRVVKAGARQVLVQRRVHDARLDHGVAIAQIHFQNVAHPREHDHHAAAHRQAAAGQARAGPARHKRHAVLVAELHDRRNFARRFRKHGHDRAVLFDHKRIALVNGQIRMGIQHALRAEKAAKWIGEIDGGVTVTDDSTE